MERPYTEKYRSFIPRDKNVEFVSGMTFIEKRYPSTYKEYAYSKTYWNWWKMQWESINMIALYQVNISLRDKDVNYLTKEALLDAKEYFIYDHLNKLKNLTPDFARKIKNENEKDKSVIN